MVDSFFLSSLPSLLSSLPLLPHSLPYFTPSVFYLSFNYRKGLETTTLSGNEHCQHLDCGLELVPTDRTPASWEGWVSPGPGQLTQDRRRGHRGIAESKEVSRAPGRVAKGLRDKFDSLS